MPPFPNSACCIHDGPLDPDMLCARCRAAHNASFQKDKTMNVNALYDHDETHGPTMNNPTLPLPGVATTFVVNGEELPLPEHTNVRLPWDDDGEPEEDPLIENARREGIGTENALPLPGVE